jgi:hypothetical protein
MDFTPGERAVLKQLQSLYASYASRDYEVRTLHALWSPPHYAAYRTAFAMLFAKRVLQPGKNTAEFRISDRGLALIKLA